MLKKKTTALLAILLTAIALISVTTRAYGAEETNLNLEQEALRTMEMVAGGTMHMKIELSVKEGYVVNPTFTISPENNAPLTFSNIKVSNANPYYSNNSVFMDDYSNAILEYDVKVDDFAKIGVYEYAISYKYDAEMYDEDELAELPKPGKLLMNITVVNEKMVPQISVVSGNEISCKAGDLISIQFKLKNEGELEALDTYVFADYYDYYEDDSCVYSVESEDRQHVVR